MYRAFVEAATPPAQLTDEALPFFTSNTPSCANRLPVFIALSAAERFRGCVREMNERVQRPYTVTASTISNALPAESNPFPLKSSMSNNAARRRAHQI
jgi:hypothetical protein